MLPELFKRFCGADRWRSFKGNGALEFYDIISNVLKTDSVVNLASEFTYQELIALCRYTKNEGDYFNIKNNFSVGNLFKEIDKNNGVVLLSEEEKLKVDEEITNIKKQIAINEDKKEEARVQEEMMTERYIKETNELINSFLNDLPME